MCVGMENYIIKPIKKKGKEEMVQIVGKQEIDFKTDKGDKICGVKLHIVGQDRNVNGKAVFTAFIGSSADCYNDVCNLPLGAYVTFVYNRKGKIEQIIQSKEK